MIAWIKNIFRRRAKAKEVSDLLAQMRAADAKLLRERTERMERAIERMHGRNAFEAHQAERARIKARITPRPVRASPQRAAAYTPAPTRTADTSSDDVYLATTAWALASSSPAPAPAPCSAPSFSSGGGGDYGGGGASGSWSSSDSSSSSSDSGSSSSSSSSD